MTTHRMKSILLFKWINDEECEIYLDGHAVITMGHGPHAWDGMKGIQDALLRVAEVSGWETRVVGEPAI